MSSTTLPRPARSGLSPVAGAGRRLRSRAGQPQVVEASARWRIGLLSLLVATAVAYLLNLTASGDANSFYAAAVQAGTRSWKAFFFGSIDAHSFITVDKPPASLWVMELSGRLFGFSSASMLVPQALEGVLAVGLLSVSVKRWFGSGAGLLAGALLAVTPVAALMFRFNNPDALLVLLLVAAALCLVRALEEARARWLLAVGTLIGFAFLAKMMQAFLVLPGFALVYLIAAPTDLRRRITGLLAGGLALVLSAGWWVAIVALWPAGSRPMIDGSAKNSVLDLIVGYNGLGRIFGSGGPGGAGGGGAGGNFSGATGPLRLFNSVMGGQSSWLLPAAGLVVLVGLWLRRREARTDRLRAALILWGSWLLVSGAVFSFGSGVIHTYYTVALAPAIAALVAIGVVALWRARSRLSARLALAAGMVLTAGWAIALLDRTPDWQSWLAPLVAATAVLGAAGLLLTRSRPLARGAAALAAVACLAGPVAYSLQTLGSVHTGSVPSAGPSSGGSRSGGRAGGAGLAGAPGGGGTVSVALRRALTSDASSFRWVAATSGSQSAASLELATDGAPVMAIGGFNNQGGNLSLAAFQRLVKAGQVHFYIAGDGGGPGGMATRTGGAPGGVAAPPGAGSAPSGLGFGGAGGPGSGTAPGGSGGADTGAISTWVKAHYQSTTIGGRTVYDLTRPLT